MKNYIYLFAIGWLLFSCNSSDNELGASADWLIPVDQVFDGGPGKDGIPSIDNPVFESIQDIDFLDSSDLIIAIKVGSTVKGYPHEILDWHEIVNDEIDGLPIALTYCPLTGTGIGWHRMINGVKTTFGVSGLLYNANLIPYDRATNSNWSQILLKSVEGDQQGATIVTQTVIEMNWHSFKKHFPDGLVLSTDTGFSRSYGSYPYGDYRTNHDNLIFPITTDDARLDRKARGLGLVMNEEAKFFSFDSFTGSTITLIEDEFQNEQLVLFGSQSENFIVSFRRTLTDGTVLHFNMDGEKIMDQEGNTWNIFGEATAGPRVGQRLQPVDQFIGYWFSFGTFYPGLEIY